MATPNDQRTTRTHWWAVDVVREHVEKAADQIARFEAANFHEFMESQLGPDDGGPSHFALRLESPLEALFYVWWHAMLHNSYWGSRLMLTTQEHIEAGGARYRLDFVVDTDPSDRERFERHGFAWPLIAVEVDGHAFHEKTPEQVAYRNQRDRALQQAGWIVFHFSWSELTTRPEECVGEVIGVARKRYEALKQSVWAAERAAENKADALTGQES